MFLLASHERDDNPEKWRFPIVNRLFSGTKRNVLKSMISQS